jgi:hypothetical protein
MKLPISIHPYDSIGDSLSSINLNYLNLEVSTLNIQASSDSLWTPMFNYFLTYGDFLKETSTIAMQYSAVISQATTQIQSNSASWCKPISIFYPSIFPASSAVNDISNVLTSWINTYFPITLSGTNIPNYIENQIAVIYSHTWQLGSYLDETQIIQDQTICSTQPKSTCATCTDYYSGGEWCGTDTWTTCSGVVQYTSCGTADCGYSSPPFEPITHQTAYGKIKASVEFKFQDRNECSPILAFVFRINNCEWVFDKFLT